MTIQLTTPDARTLPDAILALRAWQREGAPIQLHPGDLGWFQRFGADQAAAAIRMWTGPDGILAVGLLDGPDVLRVTTAPDARADAGLALAIAGDLAEVLPAGTVAVEAPPDAALRNVLRAEGWRQGEAWTPLHRELRTPVVHSGLRIERCGPAEVADRVAVHRAAFAGSTFTAENWHAMAAGVAYRDAWCLVGYDDQDAAAAAVTVWSAGIDRPGLIEPLGVCPDQRGRGYGRTITLAAAAALRELGASSVLVVTPSSNVAAVAAYRSAGFEPLAERHDLTRD